MITSKAIIYAKCTELWGVNTQVDMCIEEMAELTQALCKAKRNKRPVGWLTSVLEEIADVSIMLEQMISIFEGDIAIPKEIGRKLERLERRIENENH